MKKLLTFICFSLLLSPVNAQPWKTVKLDSSVSIDLPFAHTIKDTLGFRMLISKLAYGDIQVLITPDNPQRMPDIEKKRHLLKYYDSYIKKIKASSAKGNITNEKDVKLGNLELKDFSLEVDSGRGIQVRDFRILHENGATYTFQLLYKNLHKEYIGPERSTFFNSIKVANSPGLKSQFTAGADARDDTNRMVFILGSALVIALLVFIIYRIQKKKPKLN